ncbi:50S ribosomal protein L25/general stress protein Ctc [Elongatibacter sediminis]|uniref:Large ribosomal subunit protein bL25 n=1 Tax=Elongatibacter sediminis TaxID=3119006 RepID=A0AAW9R681_9GAMM
MSEQHTIAAELREDVGKGASRRLRHAGRVPAILYGGHLDPVALTLDQHEMRHATEQESFYSSIIEIKIGDDATQQAVVRDLQRHPFKPVIMHVDFMRITAGEKLTIAVPIHFVGEGQSPAGKTSGVVIQHQVTEVDIEAVPAALPEFLSVDLSKMEPGDTVLLSQIELPDGVSIPALAVSDDNDVAIAIATHIRETQGTGAAAEEAAEAEADIETAADAGEDVDESDGSAEESDDKGEGD